MARDFTKNTSNYMSLGAGAFNAVMSGAAACSMTCWVRLDSRESSTGSNAHDDLFCAWVGSAVALDLNLGNTDSRKDDWLIGGRSQNGDAFQFACRDSAAPTLGKWYCIGAVLDYAGDYIYLYENGVLIASASVTFGASAYTAGSPTNIDAIGASCTSAPSSTSRQVDGAIAEVAIWRSRLGAGDFRALWQGADPRAVMPNALAAYWPLAGQRSPELDLIKLRTGTVTGAVGERAHPPVRGPWLARRRWYMKSGAVAAGGFQPAWARGSNILIGAGA